MPCLLLKQEQSRTRCCTKISCPTMEQSTNRQRSATTLRCLSIPGKSSKVIGPERMAPRGPKLKLVNPCPTCLTAAGVVFPDGADNTLWQLSQPRAVSESMSLDGAETQVRASLSSVLLSGYYATKRWTPVSPKRTCGYKVGSFSGEGR